MKKLLALLLALMMPFCALAEAYGVSVAIDTDEQLFSSYLKAALKNVEDAAADPQLDVYIRLIQQLLDGLAVNVTFQDDAIALDILLGGGAVLDLTLYEDGENVILTSSLLEGYALEERIDRSMPEANAFPNGLHSVDWLSISAMITKGIDQWLHGMTPVVTHGAFTGDAYDGGTQCKTWAIEDKDVVALVEGVLSGEVRQVLCLLLDAAGFDANELLNQLDNVNARVAKENIYRYLVRAVTDDQGTLIGCSLTVYSETAQLATASLGIKEKELCLVFGFGVHEKNYWCELTGGARGRGNLTFLSGKCTEWLAEKEQSFEYVKTVNAPVSSQSWYCNVTKSGKRYLWDASIYEGDKTNYAYYYSSAGTIIPAVGTLDCSISIGDSSYTPLSLKLKCGPVDEIQAPDASLERCSMSDPNDAARYQAVMEQVSSRLVARLLKLIPLDVLLQLNMPELP